MSTPTDPPTEPVPHAAQPGPTPAAEPGPVPHTEPGPSGEPPAGAAPLGPPPAGYTPGYPPPGYPPYAPPFAAVPREPWVNPARRNHVLAAALVGALLFGGAGVLLGHAIGNSRDDHGGMMRVDDGYRGNGGPGMGMLPGHGPLKNGPRMHPPGDDDSTRPTPTPSQTKTS